MDYEAATADLNDVNMIDPYHLAEYNKVAVNYNRDIEIFPVLNALFEKLMGHSPYKSPTDMGVNMAGYAICDDEVCCEASKQEIIRRYYAALVARRKGVDRGDEAGKISLIMDKLGLKAEDRAVVPAANAVKERTGGPAAAIELNDGRIVTGKTSDLFGCSSAMLLNALKALANIDDDIKLLSPVVVEPIQKLKTTVLGSRNPRLHTDEVLIALSISAATNDTAKKAMAQLEKLKGCQVHTTVILSPVDETVFRKLGVDVTSEPIYSTKQLYHKN